MTSPKGRILCTEDDADTRELLTLVLTAEGYDVQCTQDAEQAISLAQNQNFDLFLFDNWMPGISGAELTRMMRRFDVKTPILFYSGAGFDADKQNASSAGAQGYLVKPVHNDVLIREVARLIAEAKIATPMKVLEP